MEKTKKGRKPLSDKKMAVTIYIKESEIKKLGGLPKLKTQLLHFTNQLN